MIVCLRPSHQHGDRLGFDRLPVSISQWQVGLTVHGDRWWWVDGVARQRITLAVVVETAVLTEQGWRVSSVVG